MRVPVIFNHSPFYVEDGRIYMPVWFHAEHHRRETIHILRLDLLVTYGVLEEVRRRKQTVTNTGWVFHA